MTADNPAGFARLTTPLKILIIISLALLPIGVLSTWVAKRNLDAANAAINHSSLDQSNDAAIAVERLIGRHALAVRIAASAALEGVGADACDRARNFLRETPAISSQFSLEDAAGKRLCMVGDMGAEPRQPAVAPGDIRAWLDPSQQVLFVRVGVAGGSATICLSAKELADAMLAGEEPLRLAALEGGGRTLTLVDRPVAGTLIQSRIPVASGRLVAHVGVERATISQLERLVILLPILMWAAAAVICWWMVHRLLIQPLRRLQATVLAYQPGGGDALTIPAALGPALEIHELGNAFQRAVSRIEGAEREAREALDGQRKLVREVHHRVKNNLQVVASLLSIHGRITTDPEAQAAYAAIGRRVDALSVVHRNHYAELEEHRGIALRPLLTELAAGLRASAPTNARHMPFELEVDSGSTTQDVAVATAFLITEIVEFAMLREPEKPVRIVVRRAGELTATLSIESAVLFAETKDNDDQPRVQFERIVEGLARQLRSPLERRLGRYAVTLPIFPDR